ncbi:DUF917 domain-containing protein [Candidatus Aerophobetes bacterium]|nr:DUF917 domain-containing protein [Candidatus Aerophobetes bacterium]
MNVREVLREWGLNDFRVIDKRAIEEITLGASILATGGGGDPEIGLLWTYKVIEEGKEIIMVDPKDVPDDILVASPACLGAALVLTEKPPSRGVLNLAVSKLESYIGKKLKATVPIECGGVNSPVAYAAAGELGVPVIDVDGMNRAFPELQMTSWVTHGVHSSPTVSVDNRGNVTIIDTREDDLRAETLCRRAAMAYGGISWIATYPMSGKEVKETSILNSQSIAWAIGRAVLRARRSHCDPVAEVLRSLKESRDVEGYNVFKGKIVDIKREFGSEMTKGFTSGQVTMEGIEKDKGNTAFLDFQNEWLNLRINGKVRCMPPDLIAILDLETGEPIRTDIMKYGYRGSIVLIPAHNRMRTDKGITIFGPRHFGYNLDYIPVEELNFKEEEDERRE